MKLKLREFANVVSGVYVRECPTGDVRYLQVKDLLMASPETTACRVERAGKLNNYLLKKGDLLFAGKGTTYLCKKFEWNFPAVPSTTLYSIRLNTNIVTPEYLCWYLNHPSVVAVVKTSQVGTGTPMIHKGTLENLEVVIPDKKKQRQIVELSSLQDRERRILRALAEKRAQLTNQILINELKEK